MRAFFESLAAIDLVFYFCLVSVAPLIWAYQQFLKNAYLPAIGLVLFWTVALGLLIFTIKTDRQKVLAYSCFVVQISLSIYWFVAVCAE